MSEPKNYWVFCKHWLDAIKEPSLSVVYCDENNHAFMKTRKYAENQQLEPQLLSMAKELSQFLGVSIPKMPNDLTVDFPVIVSADSIGKANV